MNIFISGIVGRGKGEGRLHGFPTANIPFGTNQSLAPGVYKGHITLDDLEVEGAEKKEYLAACYVSTQRPLIEAHIFDFSGDLYDKHVSLKVGEKVREDIKFESVEALNKQIAEDIEKIQKSV